MTQQDIDKTFACLSSDIRMIVQKTDLWTKQLCENYLTDLKAFMDNVYLEKIHLVLYNDQDIIIKARKYEIKKTSSFDESSRPGDNNWDKYHGKKLSIILSYGHQWKMITEEEQLTFKSERIVKWSPSNVDLSFSGLQRKQDRTYISNELGISRTEIG